MFLKVNLLLKIFCIQDTIKEIKKVSRNRKHVDCQRFLHFQNYSFKTCPSTLFITIFLFCTFCQFSNCLVCCGGDTNVHHWLHGSLLQLDIIRLLHSPEVSQNFSSVREGVIHYHWFLIVRGSQIKIFWFLFFLIIFSGPSGKILSASPIFFTLKN